MTPNEQSHLTKLLSHPADLEPRLQDPTAEALVQAAAAAHPGLAYQLAYRVVRLTLALESAESQIEFLRRAVRERAMRPAASVRRG